MKLGRKYNLLNTPSPPHQITEVKKIQWKLYEELISQSMPYQPLFTWCSHPKKLKTL